MCTVHIPPPFPPPTAGAPRAEPSKRGEEEEGVSENFRASRQGQSGPAPVYDKLGSSWKEDMAAVCAPSVAHALENAGNPVIV